MTHSIINMHFDFPLSKEQRSLLTLPEKVDDVSIFYILLNDAVSAFEITNGKDRGILSALLEDSSSMEGAHASLQGQRYLAHKCGFPPPEVHHELWHRRDIINLDPNKIRKGMRLFKYIIEDPILAQEWVIQKILLAKYAAADWEWEYQDNHRLKHAGVQCDCARDLKGVSEAQAPLKLFDIMMLEEVRLELRKAFWSVGKAVPTFNSYMKNIFDEVREKYKDKRAAVEMKEREDIRKFSADFLVPFVYYIREEMALGELD